MIKIYNVIGYLHRHRRLNRGEIKLCHAPNGSLSWIGKNNRGEMMWGGIGNNDGNPPQWIQKYVRK